MSKWKWMTDSEKKAYEKKANDELYDKFFDKTHPGADLELFNRVVDAINTHPEDDIKLLETDTAYDDVYIKFKDVIKIFVDYLKTLKPSPDEHDFAGFALLFTTRVNEQAKSARLITGKTIRQTLNYISKFIREIILNRSRDIYNTLTTVLPVPSLNGRGYTGGRRPRRKSSTHRRRPSRKSSATKRRRSRRPHRRTSRK